MLPSLRAQHDASCAFGGGVFLTLPDRSVCEFVARMPLPGAIILVHGVNSDGEWYEAAEQGLCDGLNTRLARRNGQLKHGGVEAGQLAPVHYAAELDADGFLIRERNDKTFIDPVPHHSPVIRFRWGYKAAKRELKAWGANVALNEHDYWGGGPFANGCTSLADLWSEGLHDRLFLWITAQHLNPVAGRAAYGCPPRAYYVHAALRLARLIASIRARQPDCPVTVVCHSQGNMIGLAAAFLGERSGAVADTYVLANPPYSLQADNGFDNWSQRYTRNAQGQSGRQSRHARVETLKAFFELIRTRQQAQPQAADIDCTMANARPQDGCTGFTATADRARHGLNGRYTCGRVTLYCNPHDQVISATTVCGIGWLGLNREDIEDTGAEGVFSQRVFAQGWTVGAGGEYDFRAHSRTLNEAREQPGAGFWYPPSPQARYSISEGWKSNESLFGKVFTIVGSVIAWPLVQLAGSRVHAEPPEGWKVLINAPDLPQPFRPQSLRYGEWSDAFDEGHDPAGAARNAGKTERNPEDPYDAHAGAADLPRGTDRTEAQLRYEHRARLRMEARRSGRAAPDGTVAGEEKPGADGDAGAPTGSEAYRQWRSERIGEFLREAMDQSATDHSTIMTNPIHAEKALAYDVAVGACRLTPRDWHDLRIEADWRYVSELDPEHPHHYLSDYFLSGTMNNKPLHEWVRSGEAGKPDKILDERSNPPPAPPEAVL